MLGLKPIKTLPIREKIAATLREAILSRKIPAGEVLTLESTAQELGVSITPVREAFQILARARIAAIYIVYGSAPIRRNRKPALLLYAADPIHFRRPTVVADNFQSGIDFFEPLRHANKVYDALFF